MKFDSATLLVQLSCGISSGTFTNVTDAPLPGGTHLIDFIAEPAPPLLQRRLPLCVLVAVRRDVAVALEFVKRCEVCGRGDPCWEPRIVGLVQQMVAAPYLVPRVLRGAGRVLV